ncbi:TlpA family protein disulfide reductase [Fulvivirga sedimenti]|uniref:TlpA family protein disulfide reductase n=1 Tax=Fulvivirga sedimenti TaxID=2879465 RepID=A0A9X1HVN7_9BACT|nr:TlpA disulfide reductase family protein [Fulvivirga sedimenti]MCA6078726.1 TlpA family protein disulfide reductase [Fulvivirga sedimenti]
MRIKSCFLVSLLLFSLACSPEYESAEELLQDVVEAYNVRQSISYSVTYHAKYFDSDDTLTYPVDVEMLRIPEDSVFQGMIWMHVEREGSSWGNLYDLDTIYQVVYKDSAVTTFRPHLGEDWVITGNTAGDAIAINFMKPSDLLKQVQDTLNQSVLEREADGRYHITIKEPDEDPFYQQERHYWIDPDGLVINEKSFQVMFQGNYQYNHWELSNIGFNTLTAENFSDRRHELTSKYPVTAYVPRDPTDYKLLNPGQEAPEISGDLWPTREPWSLDDYRGKVVVMDFWYMSCMPCIQAIPHLNEIHDSFGSDVVVIGINSLDNDDKTLKRLPGFIEKNDLRYQIVLNDRTADSLYLVKAYPSLYVIDQQGSVVFTQLGFNETLTDTLAVVINQLL